MNDSDKLTEIWVVLEQINVALTALASSSHLSAEAWQKMFAAQQEAEDTIRHKAKKRR